MAGDEIFKNLGESNLSGFQEFYTAVLYNNANNFFTPRNKFKINWSATDLTDQFEIDAAKVFNQFRFYVNNIRLPDVVIDNGSTINDGRGTFYAIGDYNPAPDRNELVIYYYDTQISIADMAQVWIDHNGTPFQRPARLVLNIDYYSDRDGKTVIMSYKASGCAPIGVDLIRASQDEKEINLRAVRFGFHSIANRSISDNSANNSNSIIANWNKLVGNNEVIKAAEASASAQVDDETAKMSAAEVSQYWASLEGAN